MNIKQLNLFIFLLMLGQGIFAQGLTVYITDQIQIGLHSDKSLQSPIIKLLPSGASLELVKQEEEFSFVRDSTGTGGWIDSTYISEFSSAIPKIQEAETRIRNLESSLSNARQGQTSGEIENLMQQLEEQRNRLQLLSSENENLNRQITSNNPDSLYEKIEQLSLDNTQLEMKLANILESTSLVPQLQQAEPIESFFTLKNILILSGVLLTLGLVLGVYIMDFVNRKRHGGFRI